MELVSWCYGEHMLTAKALPPTPPSSSSKSVPSVSQLPTQRAVHTAACLWAHAGTCVHAQADGCVTFSAERASVQMLLMSSENT